MSLETGLPLMPRRNDEAVRINAEVARQARVVAAERGETIGQYLSALLAPHVARDYRDLAMVIASKADAAEAPAPKARAARPRKR